MTAVMVVHFNLTVHYVLTHKMMVFIVSIMLVAFFDWVYQWLIAYQVIIIIM
jgi:hypothetical protein